MAAIKDKQAKGSESATVEAEKSPSGKGPTSQRKIPGNLPYLAASGTLKRALDRLIEASRPDKFNTDFLENVLKLTGGSARSSIPILKKMGMLSSDGVPTDLYAKFRTDGGRGAAALQALRNGFPEIFKKSEYAHNVDDNKLRDIILEITGLKATDPVAKAIQSTFKVVNSYVPPGIDLSNGDDEMPLDESSQGSVNTVEKPRNQSHSNRGVGLVYNINIVLPETSDLKVLNAIFRSVKENLLQ